MNPIILRFATAFGLLSRVSFDKVKSILGFEPSYSIKQGVQELLELIEKNVFTLIGNNKDFHGNYKIEYSIDNG